MRFRILRASTQYDLAPAAPVPYATRVPQPNDEGDEECVVWELEIETVDDLAMLSRESGGHNLIVSTKDCWIKIYDGWVE